MCSLLFLKRIVSEYIGYSLYVYKYHRNKNKNLDNNSNNQLSFLLYNHAYTL